MLNNNNYYDSSFVCRAMYKLEEALCLHCNELSGC